MYNANALKVGLFGANCSSGRSATKVPERWSASWPDCLSLARMADEAGIDFMLPIARWKGYGGDTDFHGATLETITWATGLLAATARMTVFGTVHAPLFHPLIAAKALATADHIGEGRLGVNLVVGWNEGEFEMFGVAQREHDMRYDFAQEWLDAVKSAWTETDDFDVEGRFLTLSLTLADSGGVSESIFHALPDMVRNFYAVSAWPGHERNLMVPNFAADRCDRVAEGQDRFWIPCGGFRLELLRFIEIVCPDCYD
jgi:hypothetical protein